MATQISQRSAFLIYQQFRVCSKPWIDGSKNPSYRRDAAVYSSSYVCRCNRKDMKGNTA